jgi:chromosome segregation ATPase
MGIIDKLLGSKTAITSDMIQAEIERAEGEIVTLRSKLAAARSGIMLLSDAEHQAVEQSSAATKRAIDRLDMRIAHRQSEFPAILKAEEAAQAAAKDEALRRRAEECRKMNAVESKKLLTEFDKLASRMGDVLARLNEVADETNSVNATLKSNPVADSIIGYETLYRKYPDRQATERISFRAGHYEVPLSGIHLPPVFAGSKAHWPRS